MSGYPYGNPQYPPPQNTIYPQIYNLANAPPPQGQPAPNSYQIPAGNPQYPYQPGFAYPYPGQPQQQPQQQPGQPQPGHPASMSYPSVTPSAPPSGFGYSGFPTVSPTPVAPAIEWIPATVQSAPSLSDRVVVAGFEGHDGSPLWVIRARFEGDIIPGKLAVKHFAAYVPWGGKENPVQNFEVCCGQSIRWVESRDGIVPPNAIPGGNTCSGEPLYIGRAKQQGSLTPGKVHPSHKALYISFAGQEIAHKVFEVLCRI